MKLTAILTGSLLFLLTASCDSQPNQPFTEKKLVLASKQSAEIKEIGLKVTNNGCGRKWVSEGNQPAFERPYCDLEFQYKDSSFRAGHDFKPIFIGNITIELQRINPWGREEDSIPAGGCRILVKKLPAASR